MTYTEAEAALVRLIQQNETVANPRTHAGILLNRGLGMLRRTEARRAGGDFYAVLERSYSLQIDRYRHGLAFRNNRDITCPIGQWSHKEAVERLFV